MSEAQNTFHAIILASFRYFGSAPEGAVVRTRRAYVGC